MLVAAAVCPCPPLLVPEVAAGAAGELGDLRAACADALNELAAARPDRLVVVGPFDAPGPSGRHGTEGPDAFPQGSRGSFDVFGVDRDVQLGTGTGCADRGRLPVSLALAAYLLQSAGPHGIPVSGVAVGDRLAPERCAETGRGLVRGEERVALLVMGDGSACRTLKAPGYLDERAAPFDAEAARALGAADLPALLNLDPRLARELLAAGRAPWQVLAGAAEGAGLNGKLLHDDAPYGVGYLVAAWS